MTGYPPSSLFIPPAHQSLLTGHPVSSLRIPLAHLLSPTRVMPRVTQLSPVLPAKDAGRICPHMHTYPAREERPTIGYAVCSRCNPASRLRRLRTDINLSPLAGGLSKRCLGYAA